LLQTSLRRPLTQEFPLDQPPARLGQFPQVVMQFSFMKKEYLDVVAQ
jgi:hypothetical protein